MNVTLAMPADLVADSRRYAAEHGTTLNALIRELLDGLRAKREEAADRKRRINAMVSAMNNCASKSPIGWKFNREELYVRNPERGYDTILSEDLNDGQRYCGILAQNPFAAK